MSELYDLFSKDENTEPMHNAPAGTCKVAKFRAKNGMVIVEGSAGGTDVSVAISRKEAILRAQALAEVIKNLKYKSDIDKHQAMVEELIAAIQEAKQQETGKGYLSPNVSIATLAAQNPSITPINNARLAVSDASKPFISDGGKTLAEGHKAPKDKPIVHLDD